MAQKLSEKEVGEIKELLSAGERQVDIADRFGITQSEVSKIKTGASKQRRYRQRFISGLSDKAWQTLERIAKTKDMKINEYLKYVLLRIVEANKDIA